FKCDWSSDVCSSDLKTAKRQTAGALQFYAIGLAAYSAVKVLAPAFYALDKRYLPMMVSIFSIVINFGLNWFFMFKLGLGHRGLRSEERRVWIDCIVV